MNKQPRIPTPAHPHKRREALPWQQPKTTEEDPEALQRVQAILNNPSYRRAENDSDFLAQDDVRGVRLQIDYLKPELLLEEHEISSNDRGFWEHADLRASYRASQSGGATRITGRRPK